MPSLPNYSYNSITARYQKVGSDVTQTIEGEAKATAQLLKLGDIIEQFSTKEAFVTFKIKNKTFPTTQNVSNKPF